jgi:hypothetical protein
MQELKELWMLLFPQTEPPADSQWTLWLMLHDTGTVRSGIVQLATKYRRLGGQMDEMYMGKFASSVMSRIARDRDERKTAT